MSRGQLSPELALVDPELSERARSLLADAGAPKATKEEIVNGDAPHLGNGHLPATQQDSPAAPPGFSPPAAPAAPAVPAAEAEAEAPPSVETLIYRSGIVSPDQLGELAQLHAQTGRPIEEIAIERGIISPAVLQQILRGEAPTASASAAPPSLPAPEPRPAPETSVAPAAAAVVEVVAHEAAPAAAVPAAEPEPEPSQAAPAHDAVYAVVVRLQGSDVVEDAVFRTNEEAASRASSLARLLAAQPEEWVAIGRSLVRPASVLAVSVEARLG